MHLLVYFTSDFFPDYGARVKALLYAENIQKSVDDAKVAKFVFARYAANASQ